MWEMFDKIVCVHYLPYKEERFDELKKELDRVGILNSGKLFFELTVPSPFYEFLKFPSGRIGRFFSATEKPYAIQYYTVLKKMMYLGFDRILVIEDDNRFFKNIDDIKRVLDKTPADWDIVNYDPRRRKGWLGNGKGYWGHYYDLNGNDVDKDWNDDTFIRYNSVVYNTNCVGYSKQAIQRFVENTEKCLLNADGYTWKDTDGLNTYCATKGNNICIQNLTFKKLSDYNNLDFKKMYGSDLDFSKYNIII